MDLVDMDLYLVLVMVLVEATVRDKELINNETGYYLNKKKIKQCLMFLFFNNFIRRLWTRVTTCQIW